MEREKKIFKVVYPGRFYSLISYSKAEKFNIASFFSQHRTMNPDIPLDPTDDQASWIQYHTKTPCDSAESQCKY